VTDATFLFEGPAALPLGTRTLSSGRRFRNAVAVGAIYLTVAVALVPLGFVLYFVIRKGGAVMSWHFLTNSIPIRDSRIGPGMGPAIVGTLLITGAATLMAVPLGILAAVYVTEYGADNRLGHLIRFLADVMAGVPSIVMGLFIYTIWVLRLKEHGQTAFAGALALACLMLPIVIRAAESMLRLVPRELREASVALGARRSRTILTVVLPAALPGITSGCLLAIARAAGETAPLLFTIGYVTRANTHLFSGTNTALSAQIFINAQSPFVGAQQRAWGAAFALIGIVLVLTVVARVLSARFTIREH
jgi:phosphate transport system permease protein